MGWVGFVLIGGGALTVWAGFEGVNIVDVLTAVITGQPIPRATGQDGPTPPPPDGTQGKSGFDKDAGPGKGAGGSGGGTW